jgi:pimeloyl-ACP methyl ester carboxylesterase
VVEHLAADFRVLMPDLRGLGGIPGPAGGYDKHTLAGDIRDIVRAEFRDQPIVLCGHDVGGYVAYAYALTRRDSVSALVIVDAPPPGTSYMDSMLTDVRNWHIAFHASVDVAHMLISGRERQYIDYFIKSRAYDLGAISAEDIDRYAAAYAAPGALRSALEMYRSLPEDRVLNRATLASDGKLTMPVTVVGSGVFAHGAQLRTMVDEFAVNGRVEIIEKSGHWIPEEQPAALADLIRETAG